MKRIKPFLLVCLLSTLTSCDDSTKNAMDSVNVNEFIISSVNDTFDNDGKMIYKMKSQYNDQYIFQCENAKSINVYDEKANLLVDSENYTSIDVSKDQIIYVEVEGNKNEKFTLNTSAISNIVELPYQINSSIDINSLKTNSDNTKNPLTPAKVSYTKRDDGKGLYINCNNPEALTWAELNTALTRQEVTDKEVFFTFEHNNISAKNYYYGYRVTNVDKNDIYITVKNVGYQVNGAGSWLGENEWIQFYNTKFDSHIEGLTASQKQNFNAYVGFSNNYNPSMIQPITYKVPAGKYIYVMGGTTKDAYNNTNVFNTANIIVNGGCGNGAVIFHVTGGKAEGSFLVYDDKDAKKINETDYVKGDLQYGYKVTRNGKNVGSQYVGLDNCHGVVDADLMWTFNDKTYSGSLPVSFSNDYFVTNNFRTGTAYSEIEKFTKRNYDEIYYWTTHINPNHVETAVGTDMTQYITVDSETKQPITINYKNYDGRGKTANIGNWMVDYIDTITLVNQGNNEREFTYELGHSGVILAFVRDENGMISKSYKPSYKTMINADPNYGEAVKDPFKYTIKVAPHSVVRFSVNYNLLANSYGAIKHSAYLK